MLLMNFRLLFYRERDGSHCDSNIKRIRERQNYDWVSNLWPHIPTISDMDLCKSLIQDLFNWTQSLDFLILYFNISIGPLLLLSLLLQLHINLYFSHLLNPQLSDKRDAHLWMPFEIKLVESVLENLGLVGNCWEAVPNQTKQYVILGYTNKLDSDVLLFIYITLPRSTTYIRLAFDASIKM